MKATPDGRYLKALRILSGYPSQQALSLAMGLSLPTVRAVEAGRSVSSATLKTYGRALRLHPEAVEGLRDGTLRLHVELKRASGKGHFEGFLTEEQRN